MKNINFITKKESSTEQSIDDYYASVTARARKRIEKSSSIPAQHTIPNFLLSHIAQADGPYASGKGKGLMLQEYTISFDPVHKKVLGGITQGDLISPSEYSVHTDMYKSESFEYPYALEVIFSIIEGDACKLLRDRLNSRYEDIKNPYLFHAEGDYALKTKMQQRAALSAFFAAQSVRSKGKSEKVMELVKKYYGEVEDVATAINTILRKATIEFFERQWLWARFPEHDVMISEQGMVAQKSCENLNTQGGHSHCALLALTRHDVILFSDDFKSFYFTDDSIAIIHSEGLLCWVEAMSLQNLFPKNAESSVEVYSFVLNKEAKSPSKYLTPPGCCVSHVFFDMLDDDFRGTKRVHQQ
jgi:hypothetical protein